LLVALLVELNLTRKRRVLQLGLGRRNRGGDGGERLLAIKLLLQLPRECLVTATRDAEAEIAMIKKTSVVATRHELMIDHNMTSTQRKEKNTDSVSATEAAFVSGWLLLLLLAV
jgi:hypothetical protein